jgi:hypothetical protein
MDNIEGSLSKRLTAREQQVAPKARLKRTNLDFPSYFRGFHIFPQHFTGELRPGSAPSPAGFFGRSPVAPARVAFV